MQLATDHLVGGNTEETDAKIGESQQYLLLLLFSDN